MTKITPANDTRYDRYAIVENHPDAGRKYGVVTAHDNHLIAAFDEQEKATRFMTEMHAAYDNSLAVAKRMGMI